MKKISLFIFAMCLLLTAFPFQSNAETKPKPTYDVTSKHTKDSLMAQNLLVRLNEINAIDKSDLTFSEKRSLRKETRSIDHQLRQANGGVYISVGAAIIIVLLLIILL
jgi:hypothetical protein